MTIVERADTELLDLVYPYALDAVTAQERALIERRRERADRAVGAAFDAAVRAAWETLAVLSVIDACSAPKELEHRLGRLLDRADDVGGASARRAGGRAGSLPWLAAAAAVVILLGAVGFVVAQQSSISRTPDPLSASQIDSRGDATIRTVAAVGGGELVVHSSRAATAAAVEFRGVASPPAGSAYQMWLVPLGGAPRSVAVLDAVPAAPVPVRFGRDDTLAITVEPAGGSREPTGTPIAAVNLG